MKYLVELKNGCSVITNKEDVKNDPIIKMILTVNKTEIIKITKVSA